ncbi:MAG: N-formylglutamate amidohydrolase [Pseudomonadota bacterium]
MTPDRQSAFEIANPSGSTPILLLCDHATNLVPPDVADGDLGLPAEDMKRHIAFDLGAKGVTLELARQLDAPALLTRYSRLVIDPNRGEDDPTLVMRLYDGTIIPGNRHIGPEEKARRLAAFHRPYHQAIDREIDRMQAAGRTPTLIAIHSFTPKLIGRTPRPWHLGILWHHDGRIAVPLMERLRAEPDLCIGDNEPYTGQLEGDTMSRHGTGRGLPHVLIELRHDLIATPEAERLWAARLAPILSEIITTAQKGEGHE